MLRDAGICTYIWVVDGLNAAIHIPAPWFASGTENNN